MVCPVQVPGQQPVQILSSSGNLTGQANRLQIGGSPSTTPVKHGTLPPAQSPSGSTSIGECLRRVSIVNLGFWIAYTIATIRLFYRDNSKTQCQCYEFHYVRVPYSCVLFSIWCFIVRAANCKLVVTWTFAISSIFYPRLSFFVLSIFTNCGLAVC